MNRRIFSFFGTFEYLEEGFSIGKGVEVAETDVRGGAMATEGVEISTADEYHLRDAERGGATS